MFQRMAGWVARWRPARPIRLQIVNRTGPGFKVLKRRWVVERSFAWLSKCRGILVRYEKKDGNCLGLIQMACGLLWYRRQHWIKGSDATQNTT